MKSPAKPTRFARAAKKPVGKGAARAPDTGAACHAPTATANELAEAYPLANGLLQLEPGVFVNDLGQYVDAAGAPLGYRLRAIRQHNAEAEALDREQRVLGRPAATVVDVLEALARDHRLDNDTRIKAATNAAPYLVRKKPMGIDGGADGAPVAVALTQLSGLSDKELSQLEALLTKAQQTLQAAAE